MPRRVGPAHQTCRRSPTRRCRRPAPSRGFNTRARLAVARRSLSLRPTATVRARPQPSSQRVEWTWPVPSNSMRSTGRFRRHRHRLARRTPTDWRSPGLNPTKPVGRRSPATGSRTNRTSSPDGVGATFSCQARWDETGCVLMLLPESVLPPPPPPPDPPPDPAPDPVPEPVPPTYDIQVVALNHEGLPAFLSQSSVRRQRAAVTCTSPVAR